MKINNSNNKYNKEVTIQIRKVKETKIIDINDYRFLEISCLKRKDQFRTEHNIINTNYVPFNSDEVIELVVFEESYNKDGKQRFYIRECITDKTKKERISFNIEKNSILYHGNVLNNYKEIFNFKLNHVNKSVGIVEPIGLKYKESIDDKDFYVLNKNDGKWYSLTENDFHGIAFLNNAHNRKSHEAYLQLIGKINKYNFEGFIHATNISNLIKIISDNELSSRKELINRSKSFVDYANDEVINITNIDIKSKVRFYYYYYTPTLYNFNLNDSKNELCLLVLDPNIIIDNDTVLTDGNAGSRHSRFTESFDKALEHFNWNDIFSRDPIINVEDRNYYVNKRNAEVLVGNRVKVSKYLKKIYVKNNNVYNVIISKFPHLKPIVAVNSSKFESKASNFFSF